MGIAAIISLLTGILPLIQQAPEVIATVKAAIASFKGHPDGAEMTDAQRQAISDATDAINAKVAALDDTGDQA